MAFGLYKPGQGYWLRVLTAAMVGTILLAFAAWAADQAKRIAVTLPVSSYSVTVADTKGKPEVGNRVALLGERRSGIDAPLIGTAIIESVDTQNSIIVLKGTEITSQDYDIGSTASVRVDGAAAPTFEASITDTPRARTVVQPLLVQGIAASIVLILGAFLIYWLCAVKPKTVDFLINTDMEMKKVNWSTRKDIIGSTWVVIGSSFLIAAFIFFADVLMERLFKLIGVLHS